MRNGELQGYFVLSEVGGQARIADVWLATDRDQAWRPALALAAQTAAEKRSVCEIEMTSSSASTHNLKLEHGLGFHLRRSDPIYCYDPRGTLPQSAEWNLSLLDGDLSLLYNPLCPFLT
jgi:hypothetical protein